jgi:hypothetical protein
MHPKEVGPPLSAFAQRLGRYSILGARLVACSGRYCSRAILRRKWLNTTLIRIGHAHPGHLVSESPTRNHTLPSVQ